MSIPAIVSLGLSACLLAGCSNSHAQWPAFASGTQHHDRPDCRALLEDFRQAVIVSKTGDAEAYRVPGFAYLRTNRFTEFLGRRFARQASGQALEAWVDRMRILDSDATHFEVANLPFHEFSKLRKHVTGLRPTRQKLHQAIDECSNKSRLADLAGERRRQELVAAARVPDSYSDVSQAIGLFPLTSIPVGLGWEQWKEENLSTFSQPAATLPVEGSIVEFAPALASRSLNPADVRAIIERSRDNQFGIPEPNGRDRARLFEQFAPIWQIDVTGNYDRLGTPVWTGSGTSIGVDTSKPKVFTRISHAVVDNQILLQLNYAVWFQKRPKEGPLDPLGGNLDGVIWRVTLAPDGSPLIYDSMHACGCYHLLFPMKKFAARSLNTDSGSIKEVPAILSTTLEPGRNGRIVLRLSTRSHYLVAVSATDSRKSPGKNRQSYIVVDDNRLRSLPLPVHGRRSLYQSDGLVAGTDRLERFVLWPTGVASPGAMRQWGHHATAFLDRRHFDDPILFEKIFAK